MHELSRSNPAKVIDALTERCAFEHEGVKLYDAILQKMKRSGDPEVTAMLDTVREYRDQEKDHEEWLEEQIRALGGDPHVSTERTRLIETETEGIEKVVLNGSNRIPDLFHALLAAELQDNAGWDLLVHLAEDAADHKAERAFRKFLHEEEEHLDFVRRVVRGYFEDEILGRPAQTAPMYVLP
ncbi:MAG: hypothetical protein HYY06_02935 [Deltaproteobacteria bacterium]|nr:hypothetical protein [Deltaproteobacteria bacterium]